MSDRAASVRVPRQARNLKVTQEQYFGAALARLASGGAEGLTIGALCADLGVTSGSFYHYFGSWTGFVEALLVHWEATQTGRVAALAAAEPDVERRLDLLQREAVALPHDAEAALRAWSRSDPTVRQVVRRVDARRRAELRSAIAAAGAAPADAERLAVMGMALLVGLQEMRGEIGGDVVAAVFDELRRVVRASTR